MSTIDIDAQMAWAEGEIGFREGANNANPYGPWQGVWNAAYCDSFAQQAAVDKGGYRWPANCQFGFKGAAYCPYTEADSRNLGLWRNADSYRQPKRGDQILFDWSGWGGADHIGTVWGTDDNYKTLWCVEANAGSPQGVHWIRRSWDYIRGFVAMSEVNGGAVPPPQPTGPRDLRKGFSGDDVHWLQSRLTELGYHVPGGIDGDFGDGTEQAVMNFQHDWLGLGGTDGIVGSATREALANDGFRADMHNPVDPPPPTFPQWPGVHYRRGDVAEGVRVFQERLAERGWNVVADGWFGRASLRVVLGFQENKLLVADGIVGPVTWDAFWLEPIT